VQPSGILLLCGLETYYCCEALRHSQLALERDGNKRGGEGVGGGGARRTAKTLSSEARRTSEGKVMSIRLARAAYVAASSAASVSSTATQSQFI
jgi:hypothetical protein